MKKGGKYGKGEEKKAGKRKEKGQMKGKIEI
jgi:hypothetical protein